MNSAKQRATVLTISGAVIAVLAVGVYFLREEGTPTADTPPSATSTVSIFDMEPIVPEAKVSTEGWKTCRNEEYGYEFKFPAEWKIYGEDALNDAPVKRSYVRESEECNGANILLTSNNILAGERSGEELYVEVRPTMLSEHDYWFDYFHERQSKDEVQSILVDGKLAVLGVASWIRYDGSRSWGIRAINDGDIYRLYGGFYDEQHQTVFTILSTLRFLDTATTSEATVSE